MSRESVRSVLLVLLSGTAFVTACGSSDATPVAGTDDGGFDGASQADAGRGDGGADACVDTPTDPKCLEDSRALFVSSPNGNDQDATGTQAKPFKTIGAALARLTPAQLRVYVCDGTYPEDIALTAAHSGVGIFGGVDCTWKPAPASQPVIGASANPLKINGTKALAIADVAVVAKDATTGSSIAAFMNGGDTTFKRVRLSAGKGADAKDADLVPFTTLPSQTDLNGANAPDTTNGGPAHSYSCPGGLVTKGGKGGDIGNPGAPGTPGPANPGATSNCSASAATINGHAGNSGQNGAGALNPGDLSGDGRLSDPGVAGATGSPGQGGGGGYGASGAGGGGAAGGCGGAGGSAGAGGGASIALAVHLASVMLQESTLEAKDGGRGAKGSGGQDGQTIFGFRGNGSGGACNGGSGGVGGSGGIGGGGAA